MMGRVRGMDHNSLVDGGLRPIDAVEAILILNAPLANSKAWSVANELKKG